MKKKIPLFAVLALATVFIVGCGDDADSRISDADAICLKTIRAGGTCGTAGAAATTTATTTSTVTVTQTN